MTSNPFSEFDLQGRIDRLFVYPIKSCAGIELREVAVWETGLDLDRAWMVVDAHGEFVSQREYPRMALIKPQIKGNDLILRAPGMLALHVRIDAVQGCVQATVWSDTVHAFDMGDIAAQWFTDFLSLSPAGQPVVGAAPHRLVRFDPDHPRYSNTAWTGGVDAPNQFSDGFALLVLGAASMDDLNARLAQAGEVAVGVERFRPNIVVSGWDAHDEDRADVVHVSLGDSAEGAATQGDRVILKLVKPCVRCPIPNIDPATANSTPGVGDTLQIYRQDPRMDGRVTFGMNAIVLQGGGTMLRVGQVVGGNLVF